MKNPLLRLSNEKAQKELKQFLLVGYICTAIAFFALGLLSIVGIAAGARCLALTGHAGNKQQPRSNQQRAASVALLALSTSAFIGYILQL